MTGALVLFDIDGTLLRTRGAGREALDEAFRRVHGWERATEGVHIAGSTDEVIVRAVAARYDAAGAVRIDAVREVYLEVLARRLREPGRVERCPGVEALLDRLAGRAEVALLTGNWSDGAAIKLAAAGLGDRFAWGVWAEDGPDRDALLPVARRRAQARGLSVDRAIVIGDTPADVACARADGGLAVAVETGFAEPDALARARPDLQVRDLVVGAPWVLAMVATPTGR